MTRTSGPMPLRGFLQTLMIAIIVPSALSLAVGGPSSPESMERFAALARPSVLVEDNRADFPIRQALFVTALIWPDPCGGGDRVTPSEPLPLTPCE